MTTSAASTAYWEIRSGVSAGNGGTLLGSGDGTDTVTSTGQNFLVGGLAIPIYQNLVQSASDHPWRRDVLAGVAPDVSGQNSFIVTTSGANAVGTPPGNDGNSFFSSTFFGLSFVPTSDPSLEGPGTWDYSMGVVGTATVAIPEPSSVIWELVGLVISAGYVRTGAVPALDLTVTTNPRADFDAGASSDERLLSSSSDPILHLKIFWLIQPFAGSPASRPSNTRVFSSLTARG